MSDSEDDFASADEGEVDSSSKVAQMEKKVESTSSITPNVETRSESKSSSIKDKSKSAISKDSTKIKTAEETKPLEKKNKAKHDQKGDKIDKTEASGGTPDHMKGNDIKPKGKKGKQKNLAGKNKKIKQKESNSRSQTSPSETLVDKHDVPGSEKNDFADLDSDKVDGVNAVKPSEITHADNGNETLVKKIENDSADSSMDTQNDMQSDNLGLEQKADLIKSPSSQSISRPAPDHTDKQEEVLHKLALSAKESSGGWSWGWGSSLLDAASNSVSTFTNQVGEGFSTMIETVESTLNMPDPEELARQDTDTSGHQDDDNDASNTENTSKADKNNEYGSHIDVKNEESDKQSKEKTEADDQSGEAEEKTAIQSNESASGWFSAWGMSNITKMVESTSKNLVTGSLDVLETLGKKTFDVINEHDPGLKKARSFLHDRQDKPNLSAILRDAKEQEEVRVQHEKESEEARKAHFGSLFDEFQGLAHLEALEMLSNQCEKKVNILLNALSAEMISTIKPQLLVIKQNFETTDDENDDDITEQQFDVLVTDILKRLNIGTTADKLVKTRQNIEESLKKHCCDSAEKSEIQEIHRVAISSLAELTSKCIEQFHKAGELILFQKSKDYNYVDSSHLLQSLTKILTSETGILSTKFTECLNKMEGDDEIKVKHVVTNIFLEASNSSSYIQDGFQLLLPVIQQAVLECSQEPE